MTEKDDSAKDNKPKNPLVESMRKSKGTGASPGSNSGHDVQRNQGSRIASPRPESASEERDSYQTGGLRWPD